MRFLCMFVAVSAALVSCGCSEKPPAADPGDFNKETKKAVEDFVKAARDNPKTVKTQAQVFLERLEAHRSHPTGDKKPVYEELTQKCKELMQSSSSADVNQKLAEMTAAANKLGG